MASWKKDLNIDQGATFRAAFTWRAGDLPKPVNLTGCTARAQMRTRVDSTTPLLDLTTENGRIVLGGAAGTIELRLTAVETAAVNWESAVYDLEIVFPNAEVRRLIYGSVRVSKEVTRV